ncbi:MAG: hypothetical protein JRF63_14510 [Deltaproteobacteria bacterium]|nr:hypothetical protein [Deltaproteobacteria bacterium]
MKNETTTTRWVRARELVSVLALLLALTQAAACTTTHTVRTVGQGNVGIETSLGGPMFTNLGAPIFAPNLFVGARYGVLQDLDVSAAYNLTAPIIPGLPLDLMLGAHWVPIQPGVRSQAGTPKKGWSLATAFQLHSLSDFETGFMVFPAIDLAGGYRYRWFNPFVGVSLGLHFYRPFDEVHPTMLSPYVGAEFILSDKAALSFRITFFDVTYNYWGSSVDWVYLSTDEDAQERHALFGIGLGFSWDFVDPPPPPAEEPPAAEPPPEDAAPEETTDTAGGEA